MMTQNLWDTAKAVLRGELIAIQSYLKKQEKHQVDNLITSTEIEVVIKNFPKNKSPGPYSFTREFYQIFREELMPILLKLSKN